MSQSTVSRFERGIAPAAGVQPGLLPKPEQVETIAAILAAEGVPEAERSRLVELAEEAAEEAAGLVRVRVLLQRGVAHLQRRLYAREHHVRRMVSFHPNLVPGLGQTEAYIRHIASTGDQSAAETEDFVRWRLERQRQMAEPERQLTLILTEGSLMFGPSAEIMAEQCAHLARLATTRPTWTVAVIPAIPRGGPTFYPPSGFDLYDDRQVFIGTTAGNALNSDPVIAADHIGIVQRLLAMAETGAGAARELRRIRRRFT